MEIIPVIDIKGGSVVHARAGLRAEYRPIETPLAKGADPAAVALGLAALFPFKTLYVADLDGIERGRPDEAVQARLLAAWPGARLLIDDGRTGGCSDGEPLRRRGVVGSESIRDLDEVRDAHVLSLDFKGGVFLGPRPLFDQPDLWPAEVIVMSLDAVGVGAGPDFERVCDVIARGAGRVVHAAGGVRGIEDLRALKALGAGGALVATALHAGQIKTRDLEEIAG